MHDHRSSPLALGFCAVSLVCLTLAARAAAQGLTVTGEEPDGIFNVGDTVRWRIRWDAGDAPDAGNAPREVQYVLKRDGLTLLRAGTLPLDRGEAILEATFEQPGALLLQVEAPAPATQPTTRRSRRGLSRRALGGAVAAPDQIQPSAPRPDDFDAFWSAMLAELADVPPDPQLERAASGQQGVDYWQITMNNIRGSHIHGQLARPTGTDRKLPAMVVFQWAGIYPLRQPTVTAPAGEGWLALNIMAHDLPIDQPRTFYAQQEAGPLKDYPSIGNDDRQTSYFLRMYLSCYRAVDYLTHRDDWDGKTLVVMGVSQGGQQAMIVAALHPSVTACLAAVPAGCDMTGADLGRLPGWPQWDRQTQAGKDPAKVRQASRYYDVVNFAPRIQCPVLVGIGLIDEACPPSGTLAALNQVKGPKQVILLPRGDHGNSRNSHAAYYARQEQWLTALRDGTPLDAASPGPGR